MEDGGIKCRKVVRFDAIDFGFISLKNLSNYRKYNVVLSSKVVVKIEVEAVW